MSSSSSSSSSTASADASFQSVLNGCTSEGLGGELRFVDAFFSFLRRQTKLLQAPTAIEQVQQIALKHVELAKKDAKTAKVKADAAAKEAKEKQAAAAAAAAASSSSTAASSSSSSDEPTTSKSEIQDSNIEEVQDAPYVVSNLPVPVNNGGKTDKYVWSQSLDEVNVEVSLPAGTSSKQLHVVIDPMHLHVSLKGAKKGDAGWYIDGEPDERIKSDNAAWTLETDKSGTKVLQLYLPKAAKMSGWWKRLIKGDPCIDVSKVTPENSKLDELDGETRGTVEKMMFDQRQKQLGRPSSDEISKQEALKKFMAQHPEMDFSNAKIS